MRRKVFHLWLYSYLIILFIPILITTTVLVYSQNMLDSEVNRANDALLHQVRQAVDNQINDIRRMGTQLANEPKVLSYYSRYNYDRPDVKLLGNELISSLRSYTVANGTISDIYLFDKRNRYALTTSTYLSGEELYRRFRQTYRPVDDFTYEQWLAWLDGSGKGAFRSLNTGTDGATGLLVYTQSLPVQQTQEPPAVLVILLKQERLISQIESISQGLMYILDDRNRPVLATGSPADVTGIALHDLPEDSGFQNVLIGGEQAAATYISSADTGWKYVSVVPLSIYSEKVTMLKRLIVVSFLLCIGLGGGFVYWFTHRNYRPIRHMIDMVSSKVKSNLERGGNEFSVLQRFISESAAFEEETRRKMREHEKTGVNHILGRLLKGKFDMSVSPSQVFDMLDIRFESDRFVVLLVQIEDYEKLFSQPADLIPEQKLHFLYLMVTNIFEEMLGERYKVYFSEVDGMIACVVNIRDECEEASKEDIFQAVREAQATLSNGFLVQMSIGISDIHSRQASIPKCYGEALEALGYKFVLGPNQVISYGMIQSPRHNIEYSLELERQLINFIATGNYEEAGSLLHRILLQNFTGGTLSNQFGKLLMFELAGTMLKAVEQVQIGNEEMIARKNNFIMQVAECGTFVEMEKMSLSFLRDVCDYIQDKKKSHNSGLKDRILDYVHEHVTDTNLSLTDISLAFNMNPTYLSRFFKEQTGENLVDYVNQSRILLAKQLLRATSASLNEISEQVGFASSQSLIRVFKKYEGITPGQFRTQHHAG